MKKIILFLAMAAGCCSCNGFLDRVPPTGPSNENYYSTEEELTLALNSAYTQFYWHSSHEVQYLIFMEGATDLVYDRGDYASMLTIRLGGANAETNAFNGLWKQLYKRLTYSNQILDNMHRAKENVTEQFYNQTEAQARFLRAYTYFYLTTLWGDVPYIDHVLDWNESKVSKMKAEKVREKIYEDLEFAATYLPKEWPATDYGRATKGAAYALKARLALYHDEWELAAEAAKKCMELNVYELNDNYGDLFLHKGEGCKEVVLAVDYLENIQINQHPRYIGTRLSGGYAVAVPMQTLVDMYQCTDGLRIDRSPLYDPANPYENRDPRLKMSILTPGDWHNGYLYDPNPNSKTTQHIKADGSIEMVDNLDATHAYCSFTGYVSKKYFDAEDCPEFIKKCDLHFILIRYAEVLLNYAEAKIELNQIDKSVIDAINQVRHRKGVEMPEVSLGMTQDELRAVIRYERPIEFAMEGLRLFDIRRWRIAEHVLPGNLIGKRNDWETPLPIPTFNEYGKPGYGDDEKKLFSSLGTATFNKETGYLWPIPQTEIDLNPLLGEKLE